MEGNLIKLGFTEHLLREASCYEELIPGRIISQSGKLYRAATAAGEVLAQVSGKFRYEVLRATDYPTVGDYVMLDGGDGGPGNAVIHHLLKRKSLFERKVAGKRQESQLIAANIDTVFICMALTADYNLRRLERYLSIAWASGAIPVIVLTKTDLCNDPETKVAETDPVAAGVDILVTTSFTTEGCLPLKQYIKTGQTVAFVGSSGVGKSTLINRLLDKDLIATNATRRDDKGRHTTSRRELILLPSGGAVIDTPGMRELGIESADLEKTFADINLLAEKCRFSDCTHTGEPHCAVRSAVETGEISEKRLENYGKLKKEIRYESLNAKQIEKEKTNRMFSGFGGIKNARDYIKSKKNR